MILSIRESLGIGSTQEKPLKSMLEDALFHESHEKSPGWLGYIGNYTTQLYMDSNEPL